ncbi:hypothetical protein C8Q72DRAFT_889923 [Fomitopsis betulina]|nr:hypothetical protein C8Q72DRAFT_799342 [Fomitopsis betulina]KAI0723628.1 hypothetical protein C8Q72DRAFT_889923 [Fomitopsis betulina]
MCACGDFPDIVINPKRRQRDWNGAWYISEAAHGSLYRKTSQESSAATQAASAQTPPQCLQGETVKQNAGNIGIIMRENGQAPQPPRSRPASEASQLDRPQESSAPRRGCAKSLDIESG